MPLSQLDRQLTRARRRLFLASLVTRLAWCWLAAVVLGAAWVAARPYWWPDAGESVYWAVGVTLGIVATVTALLLTRRPSSVETALAIDERFGLKERVTTSLCLSPAEAASPAGEALMSDIESRLAPLRVRDRFPIRLPRLAASLLSLGIVGLLLLAFLWNPSLGVGDAVAEEAAVAPAAKEVVEQQMKQLAAKPKTKVKKIDEADAKELQRINDEIEKFTRARRETREEVRDRIKDATALEEQIRQEQKQQAERVDAFREAMKQQERLRRKDRDPDKGGPADKAADALARADMNQAQDELKRLGKRMEKEEEKERLRRKQRDPKTDEAEKKEAEERLKQLDRENGMTEKERQELAKQLERMEDDLKRLTRSKEEKEKELRDRADKGEIDKDRLDRELDQMEKADQQLDKKQIDDLAKELGECKKCVNEGKDGEAAKRLQKAAEKAGQCEGQGQQELAQRLAQVQQVKRALCQSLDGGVGAGRRPDGQEEKTGHKDSVAAGEQDKGKMEVIGQGPFGGFKGPRKPGEMREEIQQAAQEAPAAIDRQRLPASASKMARGYFEKVRGPEKGEKKQ